MDSDCQISDNGSEQNGNCSILDKSEENIYKREIKRNSYFSQFKNNPE